MQCWWPGSHSPNYTHTHTHWQLNPPHSDLLWRAYSGKFANSLCLLIYSPCVVCWRLGAHDRVWYYNKHDELMKQWHLWTEAEVLFLLILSIIHNSHARTHTLQIIDNPYLFIQILNLKKQLLTSTISCKTRGFIYCGCKRCLLLSSHQMINW